MTRALVLGLAVSLVLAGMADAAQRRHHSGGHRGHSSSATGMLSTPDAGLGGGVGGGKGDPLMAGGKGGRNMMSTPDAGLGGGMTGGKGGRSMVGADPLMAGGGRGSRTMMGADPLMGGGKAGRGAAGAGTTGFVSPDAALTDGMPGAQKGRRAPPPDYMTTQRRRRTSPYGD